MTDGGEKKGGGEAKTTGSVDGVAREGAPGLLLLWIIIDRHSLK